MISHPVPDMIGLGVQQPWADLLVRGIKTIEVRSRPTNQRGTIYIYASLKLSTLPDASEALSSHNIDADTLPRQELIGTVDLVDCRPCLESDREACCLPEHPLDEMFAWVMENPVAFAEPMTVIRKPYGVWFYPYRSE